MAVNEYVNRVETVNNEILMDISEDTVTEDDVLKGKTFHLANGAPAVGTRSECDCGDFDILEGNLPISFKGNGNPLYDYEIKGNNNINRIDEAQSTLPVNIDTYGGNAVDWEIFGNNNPVVENKIGDLPIEVSATAGNAVDWVIYGNDDVGEQMLPDSIGQQVITCDAGTTVSTGITGMLSLDAGRYTIHYYQMTSMTSNTRNTLSVLSQATDTQTYENGSTNHNLNAGWYSWTFDISTAGKYQLRIWIHTPSDETKATNFILTKGETQAPDHYIPYQQGVGENTEVKSDLPIDFRSNGDDLLGYRIYGTADGAGVQTENLVESIEQGTWSVTGFVKSDSTTRCRVGNIIDVVGSQQYTMYLECPSHNGHLNIQFKNDAGTSKGETGWQTVGAGGSYTVTVPSDATKATVILSLDSGSGNCSPANFQNIMFVQGSTAPSTYIPYGYKLPLTVTSGTESKTADIFIRDSKLSEAEYVDYGEQKIYKRILFMTHDNKHFITKDNKDFCLRRRGYSG